MRVLNQAAKDLLRAPAIQANLLTTFFLDEGTYRFCDNHINMTLGADTYIGASALGDSVEIRSGRDLAAEPVTIVCDGNRMAQYGIADPARVLSDMLAYIYNQRRVDFAYGFSLPGVSTITLGIPAYAGKINNVRLIDGEIGFDGEKEAEPKLEITLDALASRYNRATFRRRADKDQREISASDAFFSFVSDIEQAEKQIWWGKNAPNGQTYQTGSANYAPGAGAFGIGAYMIASQIP